MAFPDDKQKNKIISPLQQDQDMRNKLIQQPQDDSQQPQQQQQSQELKPLIQQPNISSPLDTGTKDVTSSFVQENASIDQQIADLQKQIEDLKAQKKGP